MPTNRYLSVATRATNRLLRPLGVRLVRHQAPGIHQHDAELLAALRRLQAGGVSPATILDLGASDGRWSRTAHEVFPAAQSLAFEPLRERHASLQSMARQPWFDFVPAAVGASEGEITFDVGDDLDGSGIYDQPQHPRTVPLVTLDAELARRGVQPPYLLKLDTHGFELPILAGAATTLNNTVAAIIEAYNFQLTDPCARFHELTAKMEELGFRCSDVFGVLRRPRDDAFWQADLVFRRADAELFRHNSYQ